MDYISFLLFQVRPWLGRLVGPLGWWVAGICFGRGRKEIPGCLSTQSAWEGPGPLLSVVIPCFNDIHVLSEALESLTRQTFQNFELILVDDGSDTPMNLSALGPFASQVDVLLHQENRGPSAARNAGIARARGRYVCCLDADDTLAPTYFEKCLTLLEGNAGVRLAYSWLQLTGTESRLHRSADFDPGVLRYFNPICVSAIFYREDWEQVGGFDEAREAMFEDWDFWLALASIGVRGAVIKEPLMRYRRRPGSRSQLARRYGATAMRRMRLRYPGIYRSREVLRQLTALYANYWRFPPMLNLAASEQFLQPSDSAVLITLCLGARENWRAWKIKVEKIPESVPLLVVGGAYRRLPHWLLSRVDATYWLEYLLHPSQWEAFIANLLLTRGIRTYLCSECGIPVERHV
ncbi:hypothetical protein B6S59_28755 [Pseudomonas sp. A46]|nr:glycosyltransferase family A protein [Pseudomonas sp. A46]OWJ90235.1 hypothetical protein B6S59_28755 [Pseudomonas sp. A46]